MVARKITSSEPANVVMKDGRIAERPASVKREFSRREKLHPARGAKGAYLIRREGHARAPFSLLQSSGVLAGPRPFSLRSGHTFAVGARWGPRLKALNRESKCSLSFILVSTSYKSTTVNCVGLSPRYMVKIVTGGRLVGPCRLFTEFSQVREPSLGGRRALSPLFPPALSPSLLILPTHRRLFGAHTDTYHPPTRRRRYSLCNALSMAAHAALWLSTRPPCWHAGDACARGHQVGDGHQGQPHLGPARRYRR
eukprot:scaffold165087_cov31-Tisochrysis_lutea.AAC.2